MRVLSVRASALALALAAAALVGCYRDSRCSPGSGASCACDDGRTGEQTCRADGTSARCSCAGASGEDAVRPAQRDEAAEAAAMLAYRRFVAAFNTRDKGAYLGRYTDPIDCFYGTRGVPVDGIRDTRWEDGRMEGSDPDHGGPGLQTVELRPLRSSSAEVLLVDWGIWHAGPGVNLQGFHEKLIVMRRVTHEWRIAIETDREHAACIGADVLNALSPPTTWSRCREEHTTCRQPCTTECERCGPSCSRCADCSNDCLCNAMQCLGDDQTWYCNPCGRALSCCEAYVDSLSDTMPDLTPEACASMRAVVGSTGVEAAYARCRSALDGWRQGIHAMRQQVPPACW